MHEIGWVDKTRNYFLLELYVDVDRCATSMARGFPEAQHFSSQNGMRRASVRENGRCAAFRYVFPVSWRCLREHHPRCTSVKLRTVPCALVGSGRKRKHFNRSQQHNTATISRAATTSSSSPNLPRTLVSGTQWRRHRRRVLLQPPYKLVSDLF